MTALHVCLVKHHCASIDPVYNSQVVWLFQLWQTSNKKLLDCCVKLAGYVPVSLLCMSLTKNYSELPGISSNLSKGTVSAATLCHDCCVESGGQDEHFCYLDIFLKNCRISFRNWVPGLVWVINLRNKQKTPPNKPTKKQ